MSKVLPLTCAWLVICAVANLASAQDRVASEQILPSTTKAWISIPNAADLIDQFNATGLGQLSKSDAMAPFFESFRDQMRKMLNEKNVRLGLRVEDLRNVRSGEICVAGVLSRPLGAENQTVTGTHGLVLLTDVAGKEQQAQELLAKVEREMLEQGAKLEPTQPIHGTEYSKWLVSNQNGLNHYTYQCLTEGWLIASDNETLFREILQRLKNPIQPEQLDRLAEVPAFQKIRQRTALDNVSAQLQWFVEPFGYIELADAIRSEQRVWKRRNDDIIPLLKEQGFDLIDGVGGWLAFNQGQRDMVHRTFVSTKEQRPGSRVSSLLDFKNRWDLSLAPQPFTPVDTASYLTLTWNMTGAYNNLQPIVDAILGDDVFNTTVEGIKKDFQVDLAEFVGLLNNRLTIISRTRRPVQFDSEQIAIVVGVQDRDSEIREWVFKMFKGKAEIATDEKRGLQYLVVDNGPVTDEEVDWDFDETFNKAGSGDQAQQNQVEQFRLFSKRHITVHHGHLIVANNMEFLIELVDQINPTLSVAPDYVQVQAELDTMATSERVFWRQFGRYDRILETNYEMMRQGKMATAETALARILNEAFKTEDETLQERIQQIDASKLPADYENLVAPYFGPSGTVGEVLDDGWLLSGVVLKKKRMNDDDFVEKPESNRRR